MKNMYFKNKSELCDYIRNHNIKCLGSGREGICFLLDNKLVIKQLFAEYDPSFALQYKDLNIDSFVFAKSGAFINDYVNAIFMKYINGFTLSEKIPDDQDILNIGIKLQKLVDDIKKLSELGILVKDFYSGNIIYNDQGFKIVDTISYLNIDKYNFEIENIKEIMNELYYLLIRELYLCHEVPSNLLFLGKIDILKNPKEYFKELKKYIEEFEQQEVITLGDAKKVFIKHM